MRLDEFYCDTLDQSCLETMNSVGYLCPDSIGCEGCSSRRKALRTYEESNIILGNYYSYALAYKTYKHTLIVDEAHNLHNMIKEMNACKLWQHKVKYPTYIKRRLELMAWAETISEQQLKDNELLKYFKEQILADHSNYIFELTSEKYRNEYKKLIKMIPINIKGLKGGDSIWPPYYTKKLILMSATINEYDIKQLGLEDKNILYIEAESPIPKENRPIIIPKAAKSMAYAKQEENIPYLIEYIKQIAQEYPDSKGLLHVPYGLVRKIQPLLQDDDRFMWHDKFNKMNVYKEFRESTDNKILIASGMNEGISLDHDLCRWQILVKVPFPSLADPALRYQANKYPKGYSWSSIRDMLQASGRVCRAPDDYGVTFIYDQCFARLYKQNQDLIPEWFREAVIYE